MNTLDSLVVRLRSVHGPPADGQVMAAQPGHATSFTISTPGSDVDTSYEIRSGPHPAGVTRASVDVHEPSCRHAVSLYWF
jgi:hypothetical protein